MMMRQNFPKKKHCKSNKIFARSKIYLENWFNFDPIQSTALLVCGNLMTDVACQSAQVNLLGMR